MSAMATSTERVLTDGDFEVLVRVSPANGRSDRVTLVHKGRRVAMLTRKAVVRLRDLLSAALEVRP